MSGRMNEWVLSKGNVCPWIVQFVCSDWRRVLMPFWVFWQLEQIITFMSLSVARINVKKSFVIFLHYATVSSAAVLSCLFFFDLSSFPLWNMDVQDDCNAAETTAMFFLPDQMKGRAACHPGLCGGLKRPCAFDIWPGPGSAELAGCPSSLQMWRRETRWGDKTRHKEKRTETDTLEKSKISLQATLKFGFQIFTKRIVHAFDGTDMATVFSDALHWPESLWVLTQPPAACVSKPDRCFLFITVPAPQPGATPT